MACGLRDLLSSTDTLDIDYRLRLTKTHEIEDDEPLLRRTCEDVIVEARKVDEDDENEPDPIGTLGVDVMQSEELKLGCDAT